jgi:hypothetical protein
VNSERSPFAASKPTIAKTQVSLAQIEHASFLHYDSWLDCSITKQDYPEAELQKMLLIDPSIFRGVISASARVAVKKTVDGNKLLARELLLPLRDSWK